MSEDKWFSVKHVDDGDHRVYITTDWLSIVIVLGAVFWIGYWFGQLVR